MASDRDPEEGGACDVNSGGEDPGPNAAPEFATDLLDAATDAVVTVDGDHRIAYANEAVERVFGRSPGELTGQPFASLFPDAMAHRVRETVDLVLDGRNEDCRDVRVPGRRVDGDHPMLSMSLFAHPDGAGEDRSYVSAVVRDVTDRVERENRLEEQNEQLTRLASVLSHDLREPLNNARAKLTLARKTGDDEYVEEVMRVHDRMGKLVDDVLALTTQGVPVEDAEPVPVGEVVEAAGATVGHDGLAVELVDAPTVMADADRLQTIFENLLTNAARHAGPDVRVRIGTTDGGDGFFVADDGPGIDPGNREDVFEYGFTDSDEGTGLGLSIVRDVAAAHDWSVAVVESAEGGARFEFSGVELVDEQQ